MIHWLGSPKCVVAQYQGALIYFFLLFLSFFYHKEFHGFCITGFSSQVYIHTISVLFCCMCTFPHFEYPKYVFVREMVGTF